MSARPVFARLFGLAGVMAAASGCIEIAAILLIGPLYPGKPQPPPPPPECPLVIPTASAPAALPDDLGVTPIDGSCAPPSRPALARQNRDELERSLFALTSQSAGLADSLPPDSTSQGLDTVAELLSVSPLLVERLELAAHDVVDRALRLPGDVPEKRVYEAETSTTGRDPEGTGFVDIGPGTRLSFPVYLPLAGRFELRVRVVGKDNGEGRPKVAVRLDGDRILETELRGDADEVLVIGGSIDVVANDAGVVQPVRRMEIENIAYNTDHVVRVDAAELEGPFDPPTRGARTASRQQLVRCALTDVDVDADAADDAAGNALRGDDCAKDVIATFATRAWRGQVGPRDLARLGALYDGERAAGDDSEQALKTTMAAVLLSPRFLFRLELDDDVAAADVIAPGVRALSDHELAARLAALLWSSTPDDRLLSLADIGALRDERVLLDEARRMLDDPKSTALVERFFAMWLGLEALDHARPDPGRFPGFDEDLRQSMRCETELLVDRVFRDGGTLGELFVGERSFVNHPLAAHYGLPPPALTDDNDRGGYVDTSLKGLRRPGLLTTGAVLTMNARPTRTSPTRRGVWVLDRLMCTVPPPPPPGVEGLIESVAGEEPDSVRALLEQHRADPSCASCHSFIDPMGLPLERYDAVGRVRESDGRFAIDDSAFWFGDEDDVIDGAADLSARLAVDPQVERCLAQRAVSYGTGVAVSDDNAACVVDDVAALAAARGGRLSDVIFAVIASPAFRSRAVTDVDVFVVDAPAGAAE